jgi:pilus assembly protein CpaE
MNLLFEKSPLFWTSNRLQLGKSKKTRLDATYLTSVLAKHPSGMFVLPSPTGLDGVTRATPEIIEKLLTVMEETFDFVVIDGGQSIDEISLKIFQMADAVLVVSILTLPCLTNVKRLPGAQNWDSQKENVKVLINRYTRDLSSHSKRQKKHDQESIVILNDFQTTKNRDQSGERFVLHRPGSEISRISKNFQPFYR